MDYLGFRVVDHATFGPEQTCPAVTSIEATRCHNGKSLAPGAVCHPSSNASKMLVLE